MTSSLNIIKLPSLVMYQGKKIITIKEFQEFSMNFLMNFLIEKVKVVPYT